MPIQRNILQDIGVCIVAATLLAYVARMLRQPLLLAYIAAGVLIGPMGFKLITAQRATEKLAELGLAFLLFIVGLEIDVKKLIASGKVASITTLVQVAGSAALGYAMALALGYSGLPAIYLGVAIAFSSTMIVVKLLADRSELDTLPGHLTLSILLFQDVFAIVVLAVQPELGGSETGASPAMTVALSGLRGLGLVAGTMAISRWVLPPVFKSVSTAPEVLLLSAISWCFVVCWAAEHAHFSIAMGALIAGVSMASFPYALDVVAKLQTLRDFFVTLFFVSLGMLITPPTQAIIVATLALSLATIVTRLVTVIPVVRALGYDLRVGLLSALHVGQVSEFALVIALTGASVKYKHIDKDIVSIIVLTLVVTSTVSTYLIQYSHEIAARLVKLAPESTPGAGPPGGGAGHGHGPSAPLVLVGCFRNASSLVHELRAAGRDFAVIDFNPAAHAALEKLGVKCTYGDIGYLDTLHHAGVPAARILIASVPDDFLRGTDNKRMLGLLRRVNPTARIVVAADRIALARELYEAGADYVLVPRILAAEKLHDVIQSIEAADWPTRRAQEIARLADRAEVVP